MIVVDANVLAYSLIQGDQTASARKVLEKDPTWRLPTVWRHELMNVFTSYVRQNGFSLNQAAQTLETISARLRPLEVELGTQEVLHFAVRHKISAYDAQYVLLAQKLDTVCVTEDRRLRQAVPSLTISMEAFTKGKFV